MSLLDPVAEGASRAWVVPGRFGATAVLLSGAAALACNHRFFLSALLLGACGAFVLHLRWMWVAACAEVGFGSGMTPHRMDFGNFGDLINVVAVASALLIASLVLLCFKRTRPTGLVLLLGVSLIPVSCRATLAVRSAIGDTNRP